MKKNTVDLDELNAAIKNFEESLPAAENIITGIIHTHTNLERHWEGEASKEFLRQLIHQTDQIINLKNVCVNLTNYCRTVVATYRGFDDDFLKNLNLIYLNGLLKTVFK